MQYHTVRFCLTKSTEWVFCFHQVFLLVEHTVMRSLFELLLVFFFF